MQGTWVRSMGRMQGRDSYGVWDGYVHPDTFKVDNQQSTDIAQGSLLCGSLVGWEFGGKWLHLYVSLSPFAAHLKLSHY